jgi:hypothetical protein
MNSAKFAKPLREEIGKAVDDEIRTCLQRGPTDMETVCANVGERRTVFMELFGRELAKAHLHKAVRRIMARAERGRT